MAGEASKAASPRIEWSIDFLKSERGTWWLTDIAMGERSFRYDP